MTTPRPGSLRSLLHGAFALLMTRVELFRLEAQEQKDALVGHIVAGAGAVVLLLLGLQALLLCLVVLTPPPWRGAVLGGLALSCLLGGVLVLVWLRRRLERQPPPFATTVAELHKDWAALGRRETE